MNRQYRRIPLEVLSNTRDLGGYPAAGGGITRYGVFIRSEAPTGLAPGDIETLVNYGLRTVVDLRGDRETGDRPSSFIDVPGVNYIRSPAINDQVAFGARRDRGDPPRVTNHVEWGRMYCEMLGDFRDWIRQTAEILADAEGCALYNCATGKDRVGLISMMLLGLAGVSDEDIIADYCVSEVYLQRVYAHLLDQYNRLFGGDDHAKLTDSFFRTAPENMRAALEHVNAEFGGVEGYAHACGINGAVIEKIRRKFVE